MEKNLKLMKEFLDALSAHKQATGLLESVGGTPSTNTVSDYTEAVAQWQAEYKKAAQPKAEPGVLYPAYTWPGMIQIGYVDAMEAYLLGRYPVYRLYEDGTESLVENIDDIRNHGYGFGYEDTSPGYDVSSAFENAFLVHAGVIYPHRMVAEPEYDEYAFMRLVQQKGGAQ